MKFERQAGSGLSGPVVSGEELGLYSGTVGSPDSLKVGITRTKEAFTRPLWWQHGERTAGGKGGGKNNNEEDACASRRSSW